MSWYDMGYEPPTPEEEAERYAELAGYYHAYYRDRPEEAAHYLKNAEDYERRAFIREYQNGFMERKLQSKQMTLEEFHDYDPFWPDRPMYRMWG